MTDETAKNVFRELAREGQDHQQLLEQYLRGELKGGTLSRGQVIDYKIAERLDQPEMSLDIKLKDVFLLAFFDKLTSTYCYCTIQETPAILSPTMFVDNHSRRHKWENLLG